MAAASKIDIGDGPLLVFGGPYSNLQATRAMRAKAHKLGIPPGRSICTGDVVAYCANPNETCTEIRAWGCHVIAGNCELQLSSGAEDCGCGFEEGTACDRLSRGWYPYANAALDSGHRLWMATLPTRLTFKLAGLTFVVIHGGAHNVSQFVLADTPQQAKEAEAAALDTHVVVAGHSGIPFVERIGSRLWFNAGVIGMPANDGTRDGWYGLVDRCRENGSDLCFSLHRLGYNAAEAAAALDAAGFAPDYARTLLSGIWPSQDVLPPSQHLRTGQALEEITLIHARDTGDHKPVRFPRD